MRIAIIGAGISGLAAAYDLTRFGHQVTMFERSGEVGGLATAIPVAGNKLDRFYHHLYTNDVDMLRLHEELGLGDKLLLRRPQMGLYNGGRLYNFATPTDLLAFKPIGLWDKFRFGTTLLRLQRVDDWRPFENVTAHEWLSKNMGKAAYGAIFEPLLFGKFGDRYRDVSMVWFWCKIKLRGGTRVLPAERLDIEELNRKLSVVEMLQAKEHLVYPEGSFQLIIDRLAKEIADRGGDIRLNEEVQEVVVRDGRATGVRTKDGVFDADVVLVTLATALFLKLVPALPPDFAKKLMPMHYQAAVVMILEMKHSLSHIYWMNICDQSMPFVALVEHTNMIGTEHYNGKHLLYISNYLSPQHRFMSMSADALLDEFTPALKKINPSFSKEWVEKVHLNKDAFAQPVIPLHYSESIPGLKSPIEGLYLANMAQIYPEDRGTNYGVRLGRKVARIIAGKQPLDNRLPSTKDAPSELAASGSR